MLVGTAVTYNWELPLGGVGSFEVVESNPGPQCQKGKVPPRLHRTCVSTAQHPATWILSCQQSYWFATCTSRVHSLHILPVVCRRHSLQRVPQTTLRLIHFQLHHCVYTPGFTK
jgi:hypothetical protein